MMTAPSPFSVNIPNFQLSWDSTSLGWLKKCPQLYAYQMVQHWRTRSRGIHLYFGGLYASGVERYAHYRADGDDHDTAVLRIVRWVLENSGERDENGVFIPWDSGDSYKNRYTLIRSLVWNCEDRLGSPFTTVILANNRPAVELTFNFDAFEIEGETISLSGHMDELVEADGQLWVKDDKTTKGALGDSFARQWTPNNQMTLYTIAGKVILDKPVRGVLIRGAQIGVNFNRFQTSQAPRPAAVLTEWLEDAKVWITQARNYALANHWPKNDTACNDYGGCAFRKVCAVSPSHREAWLKEDFIKEEWNPLDQRGDI